MALAFWWRFSIGTVSGNAAIGTIIAPVGATINNGGPGFGSIADTFNQSGLSTGYTSGATGFDAYLSGNPTHTLIFSGFEWFSEQGAGNNTVVTYDFGSVVGIDRLALWNEESSGVGKLDLLAAGEDLIFSEFATDLIPNDNPTGQDYLAQVFSFPAVSARYIRFNITDSPQLPAGFDAAAIGEVAFRTAELSEVPEASTWTAGSALALAVGSIWLRRRSA